MNMLIAQIEMIYVKQTIGYANVIDNNKKKPMHSSLAIERHQTMRKHFINEFFTGDGSAII